MNRIKLGIAAATSAGLSLITATIILVAAPIGALASQCATTCSGGGSISVEGYSCSCTEANGGSCAARDASGNVTESKKCGGNEAD